MHFNSSRDAFLVEFPFISHALAQKNAVKSYGDLRVLMIKEEIFNHCTSDGSRYYFLASDEKESPEKGLLATVGYNRSIAFLPWYRQIFTPSMNYSQTVLMEYANLRPELRIKVRYVLEWTRGDSIETTTVYRIPRGLTVEQVLEKFVDDRKIEIAKEIESIDETHDDEAA